MFNDKQLAESYERDENMMILIFAQWCVNNDLDPMEVYAQTYPHQPLNVSLQKTVDELTVPKEESEPIADMSVIAVLEMFGNADLAEAVHLQIAKRKK